MPPMRTRTQNIQNSLFSVPSGVFPYPRPTKNGDRSTPSASVARELTPLQPSTSPPFSLAYGSGAETGEAAHLFRLSCRAILSWTIEGIKAIQSSLSLGLDTFSIQDKATPAKAKKNVARFLLGRFFSREGFLIDSLRMFVQ